MQQSSDLANQAQDALIFLLGDEGAAFLSDDSGNKFHEVVDAASYDDKGMLTGDSGVVLTLANGSEIRLTIRAYRA